MSITTANSHVIVGAQEVLKDVATATGAPTLAADDVAFWVPTGPNLNKAQSIVGTVQKLLAYAQSVLQSGPTILSMDIDGNESDITTIAPIAGQVGLYIGSAISAKQQSHNLDKAVKLLIAGWLQG